ncbi:nucleotide-binding universal stress UspA family protein [Streptomyces griseochromogenes]|uniref:Nucleotide-binding universal stress UspA family protein n=1 Tax=Streptomyces griseochromogenes TaxID=68214 RepID=A0A1B1AVL3_9ACTN|nr:universal stress protein [Streptomyces griseochromogenes]ANP50616.1 stress-inducible protein [Streptomyces griseochromogenes]MBP2051390.1 nucleotide-binding universal stress UspA family protein [Streptomyces griseochromogenes]
MAPNVIAGLDGSPESRAAAEWAAREALLRGLALKIVHVWEPVPDHTARVPQLGPEAHQRWVERMLCESAEGLRLRHLGLEVTGEQLPGTAADTLCEAARSAELLVLGSRGFGAMGGFVFGSVSLSVVAHVRRPVVLVRAEEQAADEHRTDPAGVPSAAAPFRPVVLGLDIDDPDHTLLEFAFDAAERRETPLRVVHSWPEPPTSLYRFSGDAELYDSLARRRAADFTDVLRPWRQKFPGVDVIEASRCGSAAQVLGSASRDASLVVVGRRIRTGPFGAHIGHVTHAALHHITVPVAVVAHG